MSDTRVIQVENCEHCPYFRATPPVNAASRSYQVYAGHCVRWRELRKDEYHRLKKAGVKGVALQTALNESMHPGNVKISESVKIPDWCPLDELADQPFRREDVEALNDS